jgi:hypothetical protein
VFAQQVPLARGLSSFTGEDEHDERSSGDRVEDGNRLAGRCSLSQALRPWGVAAHADVLV